MQMGKDGEAPLGSGRTGPPAWRRFAGFYALSFLFLGLVPVAQAAFGLASLDFGEMAAAASARTGVEWTSSLLSIGRLALVEPGLWLLVLGSAVPTLAALAMLAVSRDRNQWRGLVQRLRPFGGAPRPAIRAALTVLLVFAGVVGCLLLTFEIRGATGGVAYGRPLALAAAGVVPSVILAALLDQGAVLEEVGWRGYATPLLQSAALQPVQAAIVVGVAWGLWHVPRDVVSGVIARLGPFDYLVLFLPAFVLGTVAVSVIASYCMNRLGGGVIWAVFVHGLTNDAVGLSGAASVEVALTPYHQITKALPLAVLALAIAFAAGPALGLERATARRDE